MARGPGSEQGGVVRPSDDSAQRSADGWYNRLLKFFWSHFDERPGVWIQGIRPSGDDIVLRFRATRATMFVRVHVQHDGGSGGGATFNANLFVSDTRVDCRANRQQDVTITRDTGDDYTAWLIPEFLEGDVGNDTYTRYDGETNEGGDFMAFVALGANSQKIDLLQGELEALNEKFDRALTHLEVVTEIALGPGEK